MLDWAHPNGGWFPIKIYGADLKIGFESWSLADASKKTMTPMLVLEFGKCPRPTDNPAHPALYRICLTDNLFGHLYLRHGNYVLVWKSSHDFEFTPYLHFEFINRQFSYLSTMEIELLQSDLPKPFRQGCCEEHYQHLKCTATFILGGEMNSRTYDLIDPRAQGKYRAEIVQNQEALANVTFVRYDNDIEYMEKFIKCSFTAERMIHPSADGWEFAITIPRDIILSKRSLSMIAKNHWSKDIRKMDFKGSLAKLSEVVKPQTEQVFAESID